jgi:hypothetical protein
MPTPITRKEADANAHRRSAPSILIAAITVTAVATSQTIR